MLTLEMSLFCVLLELILAGRRRTTVELFRIPEELIAACGVSCAPRDFLSGQTRVYRPLSFTCLVYFSQWSCVLGDMLFSFPRWGSSSQRPTQLLKFPKPGFGLLSSFDSKSCVLSKHYIPLLFGSIWAELRDNSPSQAQVCAFWEAGDRGCSQQWRFQLLRDTCMHWWTAGAGRTVEIIQSASVICRGRWQTQSPEKLTYFPRPHSRAKTRTWVSGIPAQYSYCRSRLGVSAFSW